MKKYKILLNAMLVSSLILTGCSSKNENKETTKQEEKQEVKEKFSVENIKYENRKDSNINYQAYGILKLNSEDWLKITDEKIHSLILKWLEKRDSYHNKTLLIYNEDSKKGILTVGTEDIINYKTYNIDVPQNQKFDWDNPTTTMYTWNKNQKKYTHVENSTSLDLTK